MTDSSSPVHRRRREAEMRAVSREIVDSVKAALTFDFLQHKNPSRENLSGTVRAYAYDHFRDDLLVSRRIVSSLRDRLPSGHPIVLVGSTGGGKTAALMALNRLLESEQPQRWHLVRFNGNVNASSLGSLRTLDEKKTLISTKVAQRIMDRFVTPRYESAWMYFLYQSSHEWGGFRQVHGDDIAPSDLSIYLRASQPAQLGWQYAWQTFNDLPILERLGLILAFLSDNDVRLAIAIDNCDQLADLDLKAARAAASDLSSRSRTVVPTIVSVRPPTRRRIRHLVDFASAERPIEITMAGGGATRGANADELDLYLNTFESLDFLYEDDPAQLRRIQRDLSADLAHATDIFEKRLELFERDDLIDLMNDSLRTRYPTLAQHIQLDSGAFERFRHESRLIMTEYFNLTEPEAPTALPPNLPGSAARKARRQRGDLTRIFVMWHNGSLREIAVSLFDYMRRTTRIDNEARRLIADQVQPRADASRSAIESAKNVEPAFGGDARTRMFRHILFYQISGESPDGLPKMHPSLRLFVPTFRGSLPDFSFPRARALQYLNARMLDGLTPTAAMLREVFLRFGIEEQETDLAIRGLWERDGYATGLVRVDGMDSPPLYETIRITDETSLELLPAGEILISRLAYVVEFLFWSAVADDHSGRRIKEILSLTTDQLRDPEFATLASNRAEVSIAYVGDVLLNRFKAEHKYIQVGYKPNDQEVKRLRDFANCFGFGPEDWHLTRALSQIERYVADKDSETGELSYRIPLSDRAMGFLDLLRGSSKQLDSVWYTPL